MNRRPTGPVDIGPWLAFPLNLSPRPVVLLDAPVKIGEEGFVDGAAKMTWLNARIVSEVALPDGVMDLITESRERQGQGTELRVTSVDPAQAEFLCDRGPRVLPAYRLAVTGLKQPCTVLDPQVECWWPPRESLAHSAPTGECGFIEADAITLHIWAFGGVLTEFHRAEFTEYDTVVIGRAITSEAATDRPVQAMGIRRLVTGRLSSPLGGRVLLNQAGEPVPVLPAANQPN